MRLWLPGAVFVRATATYVWSEGPRVGELGYGIYGVKLDGRVPLSRTPPFNGTAEVSWAQKSARPVG